MLQFQVDGGALRPRDQSVDIFQSAALHPLAINTDENVTYEHLPAVGCWSVGDNLTDVDPSACLLIPGQTCTDATHTRLAW